MSLMIIFRAVFFFYKSHEVFNKIVALNS